MYYKTEKFVCINYYTMTATMMTAGTKKLTKNSKCAYKMSRNEKTYKIKQCY